MSNPKYKNIGHPSVRIIEECGEVIQAVCKCERFGIDNFHPDKPDENNLMRLESEINDVVEAFEDYKRSLSR
jgi:NTP pyrophosphatase (non-canonical NTP hydrolase)